MTIEDAAVLGNLLSRISDISQLGPLLNAYQDLRLDRTASIQTGSRVNHRTFHLPDGEEQRRRDEEIKKMTKADDDRLLGYDADAEVDKWWASHGGDLEAVRETKVSLTANQRFSAPLSIFKTQDSPDLGLSCKRRSQK